MVTKLTDEELEILNDFAAENGLDKNEDGSEIEKTADYYKTLAETAESKLKEENGVKEESEQDLLTYNMQKRALKSLKKNSKKEEGSEKVDKVNNDDSKITYETLDRDDWDALKNAGYKNGDKGTEYILKAINGGIVGNVSEALEDIGIKAKLSEFEEEANLADVIDEDKDNFFEKTVAEAKQEFDANGTIPDDDRLQEKLVDDVIRNIQ